MRSANDWSRTSPAIATASCPSSRRARATRSPRSWERELTTMRAPSRANAQAIASPIPMLDPVITATRSRSRLPHRLNAPFGQQIGRPVRGNPLLPGDADEGGHRLIDPRHVCHGALPVEPTGVEPIGVENRTPRVHDVVGGVQNAFGLNFLAVAFFSQLVIGRSADDLDLELRERLRVDHSAQRTRAEDVGFPADDLIWVDGGNRKLGRDRFYLLPVDIGDNHPRAFLDQEGHHLRPDRAQSLDGYGTSLEGIALVDGLGTRFHPLHDPKGCGPSDGARTPPGSGEGHDVGGFHPHVLHFTKGGPDILTRDVDPTEPIDETPQRAK